MYKVLQEEDAEVKYNYYPEANHKGHNPTFAELELKYRITGLGQGGGNSEIGSAQVLTIDFTDEQLIDMVQYYTLRYFREGAEPNSGMARERIHIDGDYPQNDQSVVIIAI